MAKINDLFTRNLILSSSKGEWLLIFSNLIRNMLTFIRNYYAFIFYLTTEFPIWQNWNCCLQIHLHCFDWSTYVYAYFIEMLSVFSEICIKTTCPLLDSLVIEFFYAITLLWIRFCVQNYKIFHFF